MSTGGTERPRGDSAGDVSADTILAAAIAAGSNGHVTAGSPEDGLDLPTRVLDFATELVTNPGSAPLAAATRVEADHFEVTDAGQGQDNDADVLRLQWTADQHVALQPGVGAVCPG